SIAAACIATGALGLRAELRDDRAYAGTRRRGRLSPIAASILRPFVAVTLVAVGLLCQVEVEDGRTEWPPKEEISYLPRTDALRLLTIGYREFWADVLWLRSINYFGEHLHTDHKYKALDRYLEAVIGLDPKFQGVYRYAGTVTMYNLRRISRKSVMKSLHY